MWYSDVYDLCVLEKDRRDKLGGVFLTRLSGRILEGVDFL